MIGGGQHLLHVSTHQREYWLETFGTCICGTVRLQVLLTGFLVQVVLSDDVVVLHYCSREWLPTGRKCFKSILHRPQTIRWACNHRVMRNKEVRRGRVRRRNRRKTTKTMAQVLENSKANPANQRQCVVWEGFEFCFARNEDIYMYVAYVHIGLQGIFQWENLNSTTFNLRKAYSARPLGNTTTQATILPRRLTILPLCSRFKYCTTLIMLRTTCFIHVYSLFCDPLANLTKTPPFTLFHTHAK